jgi:hypothetical protein
MYEAFNPPYGRKWLLDGVVFLAKRRREKLFVAFRLMGWYSRGYGRIASMRPTHACMMDSDGFQAKGLEVNWLGDRFAVIMTECLLVENAREGDRFSVGELEKRDPSDLTIRRAPQSQYIGSGYLLTRTNRPLKLVWLCKHWVTASRARPERIRRGSVLSSNRLRG